MDRADWMRCVANLLGEHEMPKDWEARLEPYYQGGIRPPYAAAKLREWLSPPDRGTR